MLDGEIHVGTLAVPAGPNPGISDPPSDQRYGRRYNSWLPVLPTTGTRTSENNVVEIRGVPASIRFHELGNRIWTVGTRGGGPFIIYDLSYNAARYNINNAGAHTMGGAITTQSDGNIHVSGNISANAIHSYGDFNAGGSLTAPGNITATITRSE